MKALVYNGPCDVSVQDVPMPQIEKPGDVDGALREAFAMKDRLVFMNFITDQTENVWPMVKAGRGLSEMLLGSEDL